MITGIKVAGSIYQIKQSPELEQEGLLGEVNFNNQQIRINPNYSKEVQELTLLHEIVHVVNYTYNVGLEEEQVDRLSRGLYATIKENPEYKIKE